MTQELQEIQPSEMQNLDASDALPFPFNQRNFCRYEPIEKQIEEARVLIVDDLLRDEDDLSDVARREWGVDVASHLNRERQIATLALQNIVSNVGRLVKVPHTRIAHMSAVAEATREFRPDAIVLSGTLRDFDYYHPQILESFGEFIHVTRIPTLGICGGHQLIGLSFGANVITLSNREQHEERENRQIEYQYRFIRVTEPDDPIFRGMDDPRSGVWQDYTKEGRILRVWQNHGLQLDQVPPGFKLLATSYRCRNQMMVKRDQDQLIYTVQFHLEKSFEDWHRSRTRWEHQNESRDGRILFENFLFEAMARSAG
jgi:GMP synthase-like glutamine amidotransferase